MSAQLQLSKPHMLVVVGIPGAGKSFFAEHFCNLFNAPCADYDRFRESPEFSDYLLEQLTKTKQTLVIEGRGSTLIDRTELVKTAAKKGYNILFIWVQTEPAAAEYRSVQSKTATLSADEFTRRFEQFENPLAGEPYVVISGKHTYSSQSRTVLKKLATPQGVSSSELLRQLPYRKKIQR